MKMTDYIKREDAMKTLADEYDECEFKRYAEGLFKDIPSADVAPVRHGRWEEYGKTWWCSECGFETGLRWDYCPDCGARMDGGDN